MANWNVLYQGADKKVHETVVKVPDKYTTAFGVQEAIERGEIADLYVVPGAIVSVQRYQGSLYA
jgi:hypothetical protein